MYNLNNAFHTCLNMVVDAGINPGNIVEVIPNTRAKCRWGQCKRVNGGYSININVDLLDERNDYKGLENTLIHEILHTVEGCMNHGPNWKRAADRIKTVYGLEIKRANSKEDKGVTYKREATRDEPVKYILKCVDCGHEYKYQRASRAVKFPERFRCGHCQGRLELIKL